MSIPVVGMKMMSVLRMDVSAVSGWMRIDPSQRTARPSIDAVVTRKRGTGGVPVRKFQSVPAWRKTSIGPAAVVEKVSSRNRTVTSVTRILRNMPSCRGGGLITNVECHICHLSCKSLQHLFLVDGISTRRNYENSVYQ